MVRFIIYVRTVVVLRKYLIIFVVKIKIFHLESYYHQ